jgi:fructose-bisphosphate aldolase class I
MSQIATNSPPYDLFSTPDLSSDQPPRLDVLIYPRQSPSVARELIETARALVNPRGKGIYATDETPDAIEAALRGASVGAEKDKQWSAEENRDRRKRWRESAYESLSNGKS